MNLHNKKESMKIYVIMQKATEYNDEYDVPQKGGTLWKAYRTRGAAELALPKAVLEAMEGKDINFRDYGIKAGDMAYIEEIEVDESQIESPATYDPEANKTLARGLGMKTYAEKQAEIAKLRIDAANTARDNLESARKQLFEDFPDLEWFSWTQYTPYFNDGDECTFRVNSDLIIKLKGFRAISDDGEDDEDEVGDQKAPDDLLYFKSGPSDKVYWLSKDYGNRGYIIRYGYGRRGSQLVYGQKNNETIPFDECRKLYDSILAEKLSEGYRSPVQEITALVSSIEEEDMKSIFGDHVKVTATNKGFETDGHEHD